MMITENPVRTAFTTLDSVCVASRADGIMIVNSAGVFLLKESQRRMSMGNELQQIIGAVTPGTEVLLYMRAEAQKEPELQIVVRRGKRRLAKSWDLMTLSICDALPASSAKMLADAARDMDSALRELEKVG